MNCKHVVIINEQCQLQHQLRVLDPAIGKNNVMTSKGWQFKPRCRRSGLCACSVSWKVSSGRKCSKPSPGMCLWLNGCGCVDM